MTRHEGILRKVRALYALSRDATNRGSLHEAEIATSHANALIQRYRLEEADLAEPAPMVNELLDAMSERKPWRAHLAYYVARAYGCTAFNVWGKQDEKSFFHVRIAGTPGDVAIAKAMYAWLHLEIGRLSKTHAFPGEERRAYRLGAVEGVRGALERSRRAAQKEFGEELGADRKEVATMVLRNREEQSEAFVRGMTPGLDKAPPPVEVRDVSAFERGKVDGGQIKVEEAPALPAGKEPA